jgi:hypothetical protein
MSLYELGAPPDEPEDEDLYELLTSLREATGRPDWHIGHTREERYGLPWPWKTSETDYWRVLLETGVEECKLMLVTTSRARLEGYLNGLIDGGEIASRAFSGLESV